MTDESSDQFFRASGAVWKERAKKRDFQRILEFAMGNYMSLRAISASESQQNAALGAIYDAIAHLLLKADTTVAASGDQPRCSFCGKDESQGVRLGAGPHAFICNECVDLFAELFREPKG